MDIQANDFELFGVPATFAQDLAQLDERWKALQREAHPDRFAAQGAAAQRLAMQWSVRINEANRRLRSPLKRAAYLCELNGAPISAETNTAMPAAFLMQQMEWREALDDAENRAAVDALEAEVEAARQAAIARCAELLDEKHDYPAASAQVRALMFLARFADDIDARRALVGQ
ncbi:Fe-S protein assembly co-chaperone HscB [Xylophilus rhododendri]|uniref:Co-chaperone protein HscB homolog n=1 Tax=Xylophilus rhododendri TaxID=2697032 RepID=A0A857J2A9_9BURK|nr:Fe-S protein assembly co-chaperone HscB [Xylophilus rhododendri]QHI97201.1 Fe-S protein assembly co-chaperone HscB [Xylophilus rhododendri]